jgi:hypothetical protein
MKKINTKLPDDLKLENLESRLKNMFAPIKISAT